MIKEAYQYDAELNRLSNNLGGLDKYKEMGNLEKRKQDEAAYRRLGCDFDDIDNILKDKSNEASHAFMNPRSKVLNDRRRHTADQPHSKSLQPSKTATEEPLKRMKA